jgi:hypothetical protein
MKSAILLAATVILLSSCKRNEPSANSTTEAGPTPDAKAQTAATPGAKGPLLNIAPVSVTFMNSGQAVQTFLRVDWKHETESSCNVTLKTTIVPPGTKVDLNALPAVSEPEHEAHPDASTSWKSLPLAKASLQFSLDAPKGEGEEISYLLQLASAESEPVSANTPKRTQVSSKPFLVKLTRSMGDIVTTAEGIAIRSLEQQDPVDQPVPSSR